jgi:CubicO group peptidase (beta-lactamase class C family)
LQPYIDRGDLPGIVTIIASTDKIVSVESFGYQDIMKNRKMASDALFWIASQSKTITGTAVMMLVDEGKLSLDEPVTTYLPEMGRLMVSRIRRDGRQVEERLDKPITLRHLLSHTAGMQYLPGVQQQMGKIDALSAQMSVYVTAMTPLPFEPGERYNYSNQGIDIAAAIIERVSGTSFEQFLQKRLFDPLDMKSATFWPTEKQLEKLAVPYKMDENGKLAETPISFLQYPLPDKSKRFAEAAGGLFCTPDDLVKFFQMIANKGVFKGKRILTEAAITEMGKKQTGEKVDEPYGLGWHVSDTGMGHSGAYGTDSYVYTKEGLVVMYFIQQQNLPKANDAIQAFHSVVNDLYGAKR